MPFDRSKYPENWNDVRAAILGRDAHRCKFCDVRNGAIVRRSKANGFRFLYVPSLDHRFDEDLNERNWGRPIKVVLTVAHLVDKDPMACDPSNLAALCQRCHLRLDAKQHGETRRVRMTRTFGVEG